MTRKISFKRVKLQKKREFKFTWDKILLLVLIGAFILFYIFMSVLNNVNIGSSGSAVSEEEGNSVKTADIRFAIEVTNAEHLDSGRNFISDVTNEVKYLDNVWSKPISDGEYIRVTFEQPLDSGRDIKVYPRVVSGNPKIQVYEKDGNEIIAEFISLTSNDYNKVLLTNLQNSQDSFDLKVLGGSVEFDHIIDPTLTINSANSPYELCGEVTAYDKIVVESTGVLVICALNATAGTGYVNISLGNNGNFTVYSGGKIEGGGRGASGGAGCLASGCTAFQGTDGNTTTAGTNTSNAANGGGGGGGTRKLAGDSAGGAGGGFGGAGGGGTYSVAGAYGVAGLSYESASSQTLKMGSGGAGGAGDAAFAGGAGGAGLKINAGGGSIYIQGIINMSGNNGTDTTAAVDMGAGGAGSGGHVILIAKTMNLNSGTIKADGAKGGNGAASQTDTCGGGGGAGGRILYVYETISQTGLTNTTTGGAAGANGDATCTNATTAIGSAGTVFYNQTTFPDTIYPQFNNYWDNNATLVNSGTGKFNVTVTSTNGTVLLEINNVNVTATNLTANVYNASYEFTNGGTYPYRWHSWGNGTSNNYNKSVERSYTVNETNTPPKWQNPSVNDSTPDPNQIISHTINWTDDTALSYATLEINGTGASCSTPLNVSSTTLSGVSQFANLTWIVNNTCEGKAIGWRQYANDSANQWNTTNLQSYSVNNINPIASFGTNPVDNLNSTSTSVTFQLKGSDNLALSFLRLYSNWSGSWIANSTNTTGVNDTIWSITINGIPEGKNHKWGVWVNDSLNNQAFSGTNRTLNVDATAPSLSNANSNETDIFQNEWFCVNITATDSVSGVDKIFAEIYNTTAFLNYSMTDTGSTACDGGSGNGVYGANIQGTAIGIWNYSRVFGNDTFGNMQTFDFADLTINVTQVPDNNYPQFSNFQESPGNNSVYSSTQTYRYNATVTFTNGTVRLNFAGVNYTATNSFGGDIYNVTLSQTLAAGNSNYFWLAFGNGTDKNYNQSSTIVYAVQKAIPAGTLTNNETWTVTYPTSVTIGLSESNNGDGGVNYYVWRNGVNKSTGESVLLAVGVYNYTLNATSGTNYTANASMDSKNLTINQNAGACNVFFNATSPLNYPNAFTASTDCTSAYTLRRNGTSITNGSQQLLGASAYNFSVQRTDTQNYTNTFDQEQFIINKATPTMTKLLNGANNNATVTYPTGINASVLTSAGRAEIWRNGTNITANNNVNVTLTPNYYEYKFNVTGNENYSDISGEFLYATINLNTGACQVFFNATSPLTYPTSFNASTDCTSDFTLRRNGTTISNNSEQNLAASAYNFSVQRTDTQNYSNTFDQEEFRIVKATGEVFAYINNVGSNRTAIFYTQEWLNATLNIGTGNIKLYYNDTLINQGSSPLSNLTNFTQIGIFNVSGIYAGNENYTSDIETWYVNVTESADTIPPTFTTIPSNATITYPADWSGADFDATDETGFDTFSINDTARFTINSTGFLDNKTSLPAGIYLINVTINDTSNNINWTFYKLTINKGTLTGSLASSHSGGFTYTYDGLSTTISLSESNTGDSDLTYEIYRDGINKSTGETVNLAIGTYNYTLNSTGGVNWTSNSSIDTRLLTINQNTGVLFTLFNTTSPITYPNHFRVFSNASSTFTIYRNGTSVSNNSEQNLSAGTYNFTTIRADSQNYSSFYNETTFVVNKNSSVCGVYLNVSSPIDYGGGVNVQTNCSTTYQLNLNGTSISNNTGYSLGVGLWNFSVFRTDTQNYSSIYSEILLTINKNSELVFTLFNTTSPLTYPTAFRVYSNASSTFTIYRNGTSVSNNSQQLLPASAYNFSVQRTDTQNYSSTFNQSQFIINKNAEVCNVLFNATSPLTYPISFLVYTDCTSAYTLRRNGTTISNNSEQLLGASAYNFSVQRTDTANYTNTFDQEQFIISKATPTMTKLLNGANNNATVTYPTGINASVLTNAGRAEIWRNGTNITLDNNVNITLTPNYYEYKFNVTGNENYSDISGEFLYATINQNAGACNVFFNATSPLTYPNAFTASTDCTSAYTLRRNGTSITNGSQQLLGASAYNFSVQRTDTVNYSNTFSQSQFIMNKGVPTASLTNDKAWTREYDGTSNSISISESNIGDINVNYTIYRNDSYKVHPDLVSAIGAYAYKINTTGGENWTSNASMDTNTLIIVDTTKPLISILYPTNTSYVSVQTQLNYSASDLLRNFCWYSLNGGANSTPDATCSNFTGLSSSEGSNTWTVYVNDTSNNQNSSSVTFTVDTTAPTITLSTPPDALNTSQSQQTFNATVFDDVNVSFVRLYGNFSGAWGVNSTNTSGINNSQYKFTLGLPNGYYIWSYWANDSTNNSVFSANRTLKIDSTAPTITLPFYTNNTLKKSSQTLILNVSASDSLSPLSYCMIDVNGTNTTIAVSSGWCNTTTVPLTNLASGTRFIRVYVNDSLNNLGLNNSYSVIIDDTNPSITLSTPPDALNTSQSQQTFNATVFDDVNVSFVRLYGNFSGVFTINSTNTSGINNSQYKFTLGLPNGYYIWSYWANDSTNNSVFSANRTLKIDSTAPTITLPFYTNNTLKKSSQTLILNVSASDSLSPLSYCMIDVNGTNTTIAVSSGWCNTTTIPLTNLASGTRFIRVYVNDSLNNVGLNNSYSVIIDDTNPSITLSTPPDALNTSQSQQTFNATVFDDVNVSFVRLYGNFSGSWAINSTNTSGINNSQYKFTLGLPEGYYIWTYWANDSLGNSVFASTNRTLTIDTTKPSIFYNANTDSNNSFVNRTWVFVNITASDTNRDTVKLSWNGTNQSFTTNSGNLYWENKTSLSDSPYNFYAWINDTAGNVNSTTTRTVTVDTINPLIQFANPTEANNSQLTRNFIQVNVTASDVNGIGTITLKLYNSTSLVQTNTSISSSLFVNFTNLQDENYKFNATVNDSAGNTNQTGTLFVTTDTGAPTISYVAPTETNNTYLARNFIRINVTAGDPNLDKILIRLYNSTLNQINSSTTSTSPNFANFTGLAEGQYKFNATANDTFGNANSLGTMNVTIDTIKPSITNIAESPSDPAIYAAGATYRFNATITDTNLNKTLIEFDGTNYTPGNNFGGGIYNFTISDLAAGVHNYYWFANDSAANVNTSVQTYTINNATGNVTLLINGSASNQTGTYGVQTNASASTLFGTVTLFRNGTSVTSQNNVLVTLAAGFYNYTAVSGGDQNHSSASATLFVTISKAQSVVNLTLNATDGNVTVIQDSSIYLNVTTITGDSGATLRLYNAGTLINQGTSPLSNLTAFGTVGIFNVTGFYIDSENYTGSFETWYVNVTETPDMTAPSVTSLTERPSDPANYSPGATYEFNATVTDLRGVSVVRIDFNNTNYTVTSFSGNVYNFTISDLTVGTYNYRWYANDTSGNMNSTMNSSYTINKNTTALTLTITPSTSVTYPTETNATGSNCPSQITCTLYRNGVSVSNPNTATLAAATYNYTYNTTGNANYTSASNSTNLTVNKNGGACNVLFNATSPLTYPSTFLVYTDCTTSAFTLSRNGTSISNNSEQALGVSAYNFSVQRTDTQNYTNTFDQEQFIINKGTGLVFTYINNSRSNLTIEQYNVIYLNGTLETGQVGGTIKLYNNGTLINQGTSPRSNLTNFTTIGLFNITTQYDGNQNYTSDFETWYVNVTELDVTSPQISVLHPQNITYNSIQTQLNYTASDNIALDKCWYSLNSGATNVTITCGQNVSGLDSGEGSSTWRVYANDTRGNQNSSSSTFFVDTNIPQIQFVSPTETNGTSLGRNYIQVNVTASDANLADIKIRLYNSTNHQIRINTSTTSPFEINYTGLSEGNYSFNATANDTTNNQASTETRSVSLVRPSLAILRPENETYFNNISLLLNFSVSLEDSVRYNIDNVANTTITGNTTFNTTTGLHTLYLFANNSLGTTSKNVTFTVNITKFKVIYDNYKNNGSTTEFNISSYEDIQNLSGIVIENTNYGKISFNQAINLTNDSNPGDNILDLDSFTNISQNSIIMNTTAIPNFNKSATLSLYGLTFSDPRVLRDGEVCPSTICTEIDYSGGTFIFNVTQFTNYSAEETPGAVQPPAGGGETAVGGGVRQCINDSSCGENENCINGFCVKLFDIKIIDFESPAKLGEFFDFTYYIKAVATIDNDVVVSFWIEKGGEKISSGSDTIYLGSFDEKTEATKIFLPSNFKSGVYSFVIEVSYEGYYARSQRTIEVQVKEGKITITPIDIGGIKTFIIAFLILLAIVVLSWIVYKERKKIKREIEHGFAQETRFFRRHKTSVLTFFLILAAGLLLYLVGFYEFLALKVSEAILWFKIYSRYVYYVLLGLILIIILVNLTKDKKIGEKLGEWRKRRNIEKFFKRRYSSGVREAEKILSRVIEIPEKKIALKSRLFSRIPFFSQELEQELKKDTVELAKETKIVERGIPKIAREIEKIDKKTYRVVKVSEKGVSSFFSVFGHGIKKASEKIAGLFRREAREIPTELDRAGHFVLKEKRKIGEEGAELIRKTGRTIDGIYDDVAGLLSKIFRRRTKKIIIEDFEKHFVKNNEKIARRHRETLKDIIRLKEAFAKKKIIGISREFEREIQKTRKGAAVLIHDLLDHLRDNELISSEKERKRLEERAKMYEQDISFVKRISREPLRKIRLILKKSDDAIYRTYDSIRMKIKRLFKKDKRIVSGKKVKTEEVERFKNPFDIPGNEKRDVRRPW